MQRNAQMIEISPIWTVKKAVSSSAPSSVVTISPADTSGLMCCFRLSQTQASAADSLSSGQPTAARQPEHV